MTDEPTAITVDAARLDAFIRDVLTAIECDEATVDAVARSLMHAGRLGVDSHGARLLPHYVAVFEGGRLAKRPEISLDRKRAGTAMLDAGNAHGALAGFRAMEEAVTLAREAGVGAVGVTRSSHFGAAGAFSLVAAEAGMLGLSVCNTASIVQLHDGAGAFHGTNPIAFAAPVPGEAPWLLDMATSSLPFNRVLLYRALGRTLPDDVAADETGRATKDAVEARTLLPVGGTAFGFKGAGLGGMVEILSACLTGMSLSHVMMPMSGTDFSAPRGLGHFFMALDPGAFVGRAEFEAQMREYVDAVRAATRAGEAPVMAPGDREWAVARTREREGIPLDPVTLEAFQGFSERYGVAMLA